MAISHPTSTKAFPSYSGLFIHALFGQDLRAERGKTAAAQNDTKAQFRVQDGLYLLQIVFYSVDNSINTICLNNCSVSFIYTRFYIESTEPYARLI